MRRVEGLRRGRMGKSGSNRSSEDTQPRTITKHRDAIGRSSPVTENFAIKDSAPMETI
jgi:hypothetical protein